MSQQVLNVITAIAAIASAIGTVAAVVVALYLARRDERLRLRVTNAFYIGALVGETRYVTGEEFSLTITNLGHRRVTITGIEFHYGRFRGVRGFVIFPPSPYNTQLPAILEESDSATMAMPIRHFEKTIREFASMVREHRRWPERRKAWVAAHTSAGKAFRVALHPRAMAMLQGAVSQASDAKELVSSDSA